MNKLSRPCKHWAWQGRLFPYSILCFLFLPQKCNTDFELIDSFITSAQRSENTENSVHDPAEGIVLPVVRLDLLAFFLCGEKIFPHPRSNTGAIKQGIIFKVEEKATVPSSDAPIEKNKGEENKWKHKPDPCYPCALRSYLFCRLSSAPLRTCGRKAVWPTPLPRTKDEPWLLRLVVKAHLFLLL